MFKKIFENIGIQLISLILIFIGVFIFVVFYTGNNISYLNEVNVFNQNLNQFTLETVQLKNNLNNFKKNKHSDSFYQFNEDESTKAVFNKLLILRELNNKLLVFSNNGRYNVLFFYKQNEINIAEIEDKFVLLIKNIVELGNRKYGYIEKLNYSENRLENNLNESLTLINSLKYIKTQKTQYLKTQNPEIAEDFISNIKEYTSNINNYYNLSNKKIILDALSEYQNNFIQIENINKVVGNKYYGGLYMNIDNLCNELIINVSDSIAKSKNIILRENKSYKVKVILALIFSGILVIIVLFLMFQVTRKAFSDISKKISSLVFREPKYTFIRLNNFFNDIIYIIKEHKNSLSKKAEIIDKLESNNFNTDISFNEKDKLGKAILNLQQKMIDSEKKAELENKKQEIEDKHKDGIAKFGRILRRHVGDINSLTYELISELVDFINADIGGIYVMEEKEDEQKYLNLRASYAYNEKKLINKKILLGEGLIGTCAIDKSTFFIDKVDDDYIKVVSGFGHTKPTSIIICPIKVEEDVYGVIELAATKMFNKDDIKFIEVLTEDIAYTLSYLLSLEKSS